VVLSALAGLVLITGQGSAAGSGNDFVQDLQQVTAKSPVDSEKSKSAVADCPSGLHALSGGADVDGPRRSVGIRLTAPVGDGSWKAEASELRSTDEAWAVQAFVICARTDGDPSVGPQGPPGLPGEMGEPGRCLCGD